MNFPIYISYNNKTYSVVGFIDDETTYVAGKGYVDKIAERVYIFVTDDKMSSDIPIIYLNEKGSLCKDVTSNQVFKYFTVKGAYDLSVDNIIANTTGDEELYNEQALADMNAAMSFYVPTINENDDSLKKIIKLAIIEKKIDLNLLKSELPLKYQLTNMKSALDGSTKMSISNFNTWCELLHLHYEIRLVDNPDVSEKFALNKMLSFNSANGSLIEIED